MDEERNIVQTVQKANNKFKDFFSPSFFPPLHTRINLVPQSKGSSQLDNNNNNNNNAQPEKHARDSGIKKGTFSGFMEMRNREWLSGRKALEQSGACVLARRGREG